MLTISRKGFENECKEIHNSWGRLNQVAQALATRTPLERQQIRETYKAIYGKDLVKRLQEEAEMTSSSNNRNEASGVSPKLCAALSLFMLEPQERDAIVAREALEQGDETSYKALVEIFVGRKSSQIFLTKQAYQARYRRQLDQDIANIEAPISYQKVSFCEAAN